MWLKSITKLIRYPTNVVCSARNRDVSAHPIKPQPQVKRMLTTGAFSTQQKALKGRLGLLLIPVMLAIAVAVALYFAISSYLLNDATDKIRNVLLSQRGLHLYIQKVMHPTFFKAREQGMIAPQYYAPEIFSSSFIVRTMHDFYNAERKKDGLPPIYYKMASNNPRNPVNRADQMEAALIKLFNENRDIHEFKQVVTLDGKKYLYYARPFLETTQACLLCHGKREDAPIGLQALYPGQGGFNEKAGVFRAVESLRMPIEGEMTSAIILTASITVGILTLLILTLFNTRLRTLVRAQTEDLTQEVAERKARENELEGKNAELERFTYTVSHDLKSPLITIKGFAGSVLKDVKNGRHDRLERDLQRITEAADKMGMLLNDLLELSRIGRMINPPVSCSMQELVKEALAALEESIKCNQVTIKVQPDLPIVQVDKMRIIEVLQNLIENAIKYRGEQPAPTIEIGMTETQHGIAFYVRDNGIGIERDYHETVFGLFNKLDAQSDGTGIGLALVRRVIEFHGGQVWADSTGLGHGTTFYFTLPMGKAV